MYPNMITRIANLKRKKGHVDVSEGHYLTVVFSYIRISYVL